MIERAKIIYPSKIKKDFDKLCACYSLLEQMRLEHNRQGAIARANWAEYSAKWRSYTLAYRSKVKPLLHEQNLLKERIRKARFTDAEWRKLGTDELLLVNGQLYGDKLLLSQLTTEATSPLVGELKTVKLDASAKEAIDPTEDLTTYTIVEPDGVFTVIAARCTIANMDRDADAYVYKDKTADHFNGDFEHLLEGYFDTADDEYSIMGGWALTNLLDDIQGIRDASGDCFAVYFYRGGGTSYYIVLEEVYGGSMGNTLTAVSLDTQYWLTIERDEAVGTYGTLYCYIYDDDVRTSEIGGSPLTITLNTSKKDFRYIHVSCSKNTGTSGKDTYGWWQDLDLQEAPPVVGPFPTHFRV